MEIEKVKAIIEAILFASGRVVKIVELMSALEMSQDDIINIIENMKLDYSNRGIEIIKVDDGYQMVTKSEYYEYIYPIFDKRSKPNLSNAALETLSIIAYNPKITRADNLSNAALETLSIIAYNPKITRAEIEAIRGVNSDGTIYKLLDFSLIEEAGKLDAPGRPTMYKVTNEFFRMFGFSNLEELPELPRYKLDENQQIVIDDIIASEEKTQIDSQEEQINKQEIVEAPEPNDED